METDKERIFLGIIEDLKDSSIDTLKAIQHEILEGNFNNALAAAAIIYIDSLIREREQQTV